MTKQHLAEQILQSIENYDNREEQLESIIVFLGTLKPDNPNQFANWGYPEQRTTPENCWK